MKCMSLNQSYKKYDFWKLFNKLQVRKINFNKTDRFKKFLYAQVHKFKSRDQLTTTMKKKRRSTKRNEHHAGLALQNNSFLFDEKGILLAKCRFKMEWRTCLKFKLTFLDHVTCSKRKSKVFLKMGF